MLFFIKQQVITYYIAVLLTISVVRYSKFDTWVIEKLYIVCFLIVDFQFHTNCGPSSVYVSVMNNRHINEDDKSDCRGKC